MIKKFEQYNESLRDKMTGKSEEEIKSLYDSKLKNIMSSESRDDIIENYLIEMSADPDEWNEAHMDLLEDIIRAISDKEFKEVIEKLLQREINYKSIGF